MVTPITRIELMLGFSATIVLAAPLLALCRWCFFLFIGLYPVFVVSVIGKAKTSAENFEC